MLYDALGSKEARIAQAYYNYQEAKWDLKKQLIVNFYNLVVSKEGRVSGLKALLGVIDADLVDVDLVDDLDGDLENDGSEDKELELVVVIVVVVVVVIVVVWNGLCGEVWLTEADSRHGSDLPPTCIDNQDQCYTNSKKSHFGILLKALRRNNKLYAKLT